MAALCCRSVPSVSSIARPTCSHQLAAPPAAASPSTPARACQLQAQASTSSATSSTSSRSHHSRSAARLIARSAVPDATGAPAGQLNAELMEAMQQKISEALEASSVDVLDVYGDGRHVNISVVSKAFEGKNSMQRQRMVYKAIWLELQDAVHAVDSMTTKTPEEAA